MKVGVMRITGVMVGNSWRVVTAGSFKVVPLEFVDEDGCVFLNRETGAGLPMWGTWTQPNGKHYSAPMSSIQAVEQCE